MSRALVRSAHKSFERTGQYMPAARWNRRIKARDRYRRVRDRKIAVDWIGAEFVWDAGRDELGRRDIQRRRLEGYNPANHTVHMRLLNTPSPEKGCGLWSTDDLWARLRDGSMVRG